MRPVRVRFAPSPTGALHIGGARTALYNLLFARKHGGVAVLRIEDTDQRRYVEGAQQHIAESLRWLGLDFDETPERGGPFAPYCQRENAALYRKYALQLVEAGHAYMAFDSPEELQALRERGKRHKTHNPQYDATTRGQMKNALTLPSEEVKERIARCEPYVVRLKTPENESITVQDLIRGAITVQSAQLDDKVLIKSDGLPTYHLAHVVDDHRMRISHVIRGEEWLPSTPLHTLLYRYLGWEGEMPAFAHLPLLLKPDGNGKLSKRDAAQLGFPILPISWPHADGGDEMTGFREAGYLPEALINFLALLGWNPGDEREFFTLDELAEAFDLRKIGKAGARTVFSKAAWFNQHYLRAKPASALCAYLQESLSRHDITAAPTTVKAVVEALRERIVFPRDLFEMGKFFFIAPTSFEAKIARRVWTDPIRQALADAASAFGRLDLSSSEGAKASLEDLLRRFQDAPKGKTMQAIRMALTGGAFGPDLAVIVSILGGEETARRLAYALGHISVKS